MPPPEVEQEVDWAILEEGLEQFDAPEQQQVDPEPLVLQPQQPLQVDWALIAYALAMLREMRWSCSNGGSSSSNHLLIYPLIY